MHFPFGSPRRSFGRISRTSAGKRPRRVIYLAERLEDRTLLSGAVPAAVSFGNVAINTTVTRDVTITVDAGYATQLASGSGINVPFSFNFDTCGAGGGFGGPGSCTVKASFHPTSVAASTGTTNVFECP